jgi:hypothetical protein
METITMASLVGENVKSLHTAIAAEILKFSVAVSDRWGESNTGKLSGATLSLGALTFFVHALDRICFSLKSETLKEIIFDSTALELSRLYGKLIEVTGGAMPAETAERETLSFINTRGSQLSEAPRLLSNGTEDRNNAVWLAACMISEDVGLPKQIFLITLVQIELLRGFKTLNLAQRVKEIVAVAS